MMLKTRVFVLTLLATFAFTALSHADGDGRSGYSGDPAIRSGMSCEVCHTGGRVPTVDLTGPMTVAPGVTSAYTLTISGGQQAWGGLDVSATLGALAAIDAGTRVSGGEIVQNAPRAADANGEVTFTFEWTAPSSPGTAALYAAGLSADGDGSDGGDEVGRIALMISVESAPPPNQPPVANPGGPYSGTVGAAIDFDGSGSFDPDGTVASYMWDFGDGSGGTGAMPSHAYAAAGAYTVELTVTDDDGASGSMTTVADVTATSPQNQPPIASSGGPYSGIVGSPITFDGSGSRDPDGTIVSHVWDFGDGTNGSGASVTHAYGAAGVYQVTLTVTDDQGARSSGVADAVVTDQGTSSLLVLLRAPRRVRVGNDGESKPVKIGVAVDTSSLPVGTTGCGMATLFKGGQAVSTETFCVERRDDSEDEEDDDEEEEDEDEDEDEDRERSRRELRVKTASGVVALSRPTQGSWKRVTFDAGLAASDAPSVLWTAQVELMGRTGEAAPVTTQVQESRR